MGEKAQNKKRITTMIIVELGIILLALTIYVFVYYHIADHIPKCFIHETFGIQCPSCGGTRCVSQFIQGNFLESLQYNPVFFFTICYLLFMNIIYIINTIRKSFQKEEILSWLYPKKDFWIGFIIILVLFGIIRNIV